MFNGTMYVVAYSADEGKEWHYEYYRTELEARIQTDVLRREPLNMRVKLATYDYSGDLALFTREDN